MRVTVAFWLTAWLCLGAKAADITLVPLPQPDERAAQAGILGQRSPDGPPSGSVSYPGPVPGLAMPPLPPAAPEIPHVHAPSSATVERPPATAPVADLLPPLPQQPDRKSVV